MVKMTYSNNGDASAARSLLALQVGVALAIAILLGTVYALQSSASRAFADQVRVRATRVSADAVLQAQLDEETGLRGFEVTHDSLFLEPYARARVSLRTSLDALADRLQTDGIAADAVRDAGSINARWQRDVAQPVLAGRGTTDAVQKLGKTLVDAFRAQLLSVQSSLDDRARAIDAAQAGALRRTGVASIAAILAIGLAAIVFLSRQRRLERRLAAERAAAQEAALRASEFRSAYEAEKRTTDLLQDAIAQRPLPLHPMLRFTATYVPATDETRVGGDWYDAIELPNNRVLFAIGDVAGHGLKAAVTMSRARQALVSSALFDSEPSQVLARVNDDLIAQNAPMVTAATGFADAKTFEFVYASAGHPPPVLLEPGRSPRMLEFGGIALGVMPGAAFETHRIQSVPGAMLVLYTDGAIEHTRDVLEGEELLLASVTRAAANASVDAASAIHEGIFHGNPAGDDVAILTIGFDDGRSSALLITAEDSKTSIASRIDRTGGNVPMPHADGRERAAHAGPAPLGPGGGPWTGAATLDERRRSDRVAPADALERVA